MSTCVIDIHMVDEKIRYPALAYQCCFLFHGSSGQRVVSIPEWMRQIAEHFYQGAAAFSIEQGDNLFPERHSGCKRCNSTLGMIQGAGR